MKNEFKDEEKKLLVIGIINLFLVPKLIIQRSTYLIILLCKKCACYTDELSGSSLELIFMNELVKKKYDYYGGEY